jgi:chemotaxis protein methyltransferase CheR
VIEEANELTVNVSRFFRDTLTIGLMADRVLPAIIQEKTRLQDHALRVWSAGFAQGAGALFSGDPDS